MTKNRLPKAEDKKDAVALALEAGALLALGAMARKIVHDRQIRDADQEDLQQDTAERALRSKGQFRGESSIKTYLGKILINRGKDVQAREMTRHGNGEVDIDDETLGRLGHNTSTNPEVALFSKEKLREALGPDSPLNMDERVALLLQAHGYSFAEMSEMLGKPEGTLKAQAFRGRTKLAENGITLPEVA